MSSITPRARRAALLFDLDGTLVQTEPLHFAAFNLLLKPFGRSIDEEIFTRHISGQANPAIMGFLFPELGLDDHRRLADEKETAFRRLAKAGVPATRGAAELIAWAHAQGLSVGLVTNAPRTNAEMMIEVLGLADRLDIVVIGDELPRGKPYPDPYLAALKGLGIEAVDAIVIEDSLSGIAAAKAAGIEVIGLTTALTPDVLTANGAVLTAPDLADPQLFDFLARRFASAPAA
jgi:beta-phosphoglucomutase